MQEKYIQAFLKKCDGTYDFKKYSCGYFNVVGTEEELDKFIDFSKNNDIWTYRKYPFVVYMGINFYGIFCSVNDFERIKKYIEDKDLCLNASNPFF